MRQSKPWGVGRVHGRGLWMGAVAPVVWLGGALGMSYDERGFMDRLGWDVWPSGLALGPDGWAQILIFLAFAGLYIAFALSVRPVAQWSSLARWGGRLLVGLACVTPLLAFRTDPPRHGSTWHGALHAIGYVGLMLSLLVAAVTLLPGLVRRRAAELKWAWPALLLVPFAWIAPNDKATSNYLFFAIPMTFLAVLALVLARVERPPATRAIP